MTAKTPAQLLSVFENGDVPTQSDYQDVFDSFVNVVGTTAQSIAADLTVPNLAVTGTFNTSNVSASAIIGTTGDIQTVSAATLTANVINCPTSASFNAVSAKTYTRSVESSVNALGGSQASARSLTAEISRIVVIATASNTGVILSNTTGREHVVINDTPHNLSVYPAVGGQINDLASNAAYPVSASLVASFINIGGLFYITR